MLNYKKSLRIAFALITMILITATSLKAQDGRPGMGHGNATPEDRAKRQTEMMKEGLSLTTVQEPKVSAINLKYAKKMEEVRKVADTAEQRKSAEKINKQKEGELKNVLTADQFKLYIKQLEEMRARRRSMQH